MYIRIYVHANTYRIQVLVIIKQLVFMIIINYINKLVIVNKIPFQIWLLFSVHTHWLQLIHSLY